MYEIKTEDVYEDFNSDKEMLDFNNYSKLKMCSFFVDNNKHKKAKDVNKNVVATM